ncbi:MAG: hypothetical protein JSS34_02265 [Proteobacteria bacterium]|nr:hypothetical protein [Pseudomonadota bacterium]
MKIKHTSLSLAALVLSGVLSGISVESIYAVKDKAKDSVSDKESAQKREDGSAPKNAEDRTGDKAVDVESKVLDKKDTREPISLGMALKKPTVLKDDKNSTIVTTTDNTQINIDKKGKKVISPDIAALEAILAKLKTKGMDISKVKGEVILDASEVDSNPKLKTLILEKGFLPTSDGLGYTGNLSGADLFKLGQFVPVTKFPMANPVIFSGFSDGTLEVMRAYVTSEKFEGERKERIIVQLVVEPLRDAWDFYSMHVGDHGDFGKATGYRFDTVEGNPALFDDSHYAMMLGAVTGLGYWRSFNPREGYAPRVFITVDDAYADGFSRKYGVDALGATTGGKQTFEIRPIMDQLMLDANMAPWVHNATVSYGWDDFGSYSHAKDHITHKI